MLGFLPLSSKEGRAEGRAALCSGRAGVFKPSVCCVLAASEQGPCFGSPLVSHLHYLRADEAQPQHVTFSVCQPRRWLFPKAIKICMERGNFLLLSHWKTSAVDH